MGNSISHLVDRVMEVPDVTGTLRLKAMSPCSLLSCFGWSRGINSQQEFRPWNQVLEGGGVG